MGRHYLSPFHSYLLPHYGPQIVGKCYMNAPEKWGKSLAFFPTVMECCQFQKVLAGFGVACKVVTAERDKDRQLEEVGRLFNVTRERIRQIEAKAMRKLRHPSRMKSLGDYRNS